MFSSCLISSWCFSSELYTCQLLDLFFTSCITVVLDFHMDLLIDETDFKMQVWTRDMPVLKPPLFSLICISKHFLLNSFQASCVYHFIWLDSEERALSCCLFLIMRYLLFIQVSSFLSAFPVTCQACLCCCSHQRVRELPFFFLHIPSRSRYRLPSVWGKYNCKSCFHRRKDHVLTSMCI